MMPMIIFGRYYSTFRSVFANNSVFNLHFMKVSTENDNNFGYEKMSTRGRKRTLTDSERKMNRSEVSSKWNKCRIYVGDQLDCWNELKEVLRIQIRTEFANILLDR